jgi:PTH1 family peptidyl-tRNA hydrolase
MIADSARGPEVGAARLVAGLGNPGDRYRLTRHNLGFRVVERLAARLGAGPERNLCGAFVSEAGATLLARPQNYMNRSGWAVRCLCDRYQLAPESCLVVYDEIALPLGRLRLRPAGSPGGHRGMESIVAALETEQVPRLRLGIGPRDGATPPGDLSAFVLAPFDDGEIEAVAALVELAADAVACWCAEGAETAMARFNAPPPPRAPLADESPVR